MILSRIIKKWGFITGRDMDPEGGWVNTTFWQRFWFVVLNAFNN